MTARDRWPAQGAAPPAAPASDEDSAAQARAAATERRLREALEALEDGFVLYGPDDVLVLCNERYRQIYRESADLIAPGAHFEALVRAGVARGQYPEAQGREEEWIARRLAAHRAADSVIEQRLSDGRWLRITESRTSDGSIAGFRVDITELKNATLRAERAAQEAAGLSDELNTLLDLSPDGVAAFDAGGAFKHANAALLRILGWTEAQARGATLRDLDERLATCCIDGGDLVPTAQAADGAPVRLQVAVRYGAGAGSAAPGSTRWLERAVRSLNDADGRSAGHVVYLRDLTQTLAAERALLSQRAKFEAAFRNSADCMWMIDGDTGHVLEVNDAFTRVTGFAPEQALGRSSLELRLWDDAGERSELIRRVLAAGAASDVACRLRRRDGSAMDGLLSATRVDIDGRAAILKTVHDITDRVSAERAMRELADRLSSTVGALERINEQNDLLTQLRDDLQRCDTVAEVSRMAAAYLPSLLPGTRGAVTLLAADGVSLDVGAEWDDAPGADRSAAAATEPPYPDAGATLQHGQGASSLYLPFGAQDATYGVLRIEMNGAPADAEAQRRMRAIAEHVALAIANALLRERLRAQATRDPLTGLANRRAGDDGLQRELKRCQRTGQRLALLMLDIDHFKSFNDRYGHDAGDEVLKRVAGLLARAARAQDTVCRYGGEEFLLILPDTDADGALQCAERVRQQAQALVLEHRGQRLGALTVSLGVALFPADAAAPEDLVRAADVALYAAKRGGRNRVVRMVVDRPA